jgi:dihydroneopterin aldolase
LDRVLINDIKVFAYHGLLPEEIERGQDFFIDLELRLDFSEVSDSDDISGTVDYAAVSESVAALASTERYNLIETLAEKIAERVLSFEPVQSVTVTVRKPRAPIKVSVGWVGVSITRAREGGPGGKGGPA